MKPISIKLTGKIPSKKNTWQRGKRRGMYIPVVIRAKLDFLLWQLKKYRPEEPIDKKVKIEMAIYTKSLRQDAGNISETILDLLQKADIITNDRVCDDVHYTRSRGAEDEVFVEIALSS